MSETPKATTKRCANAACAMKDTKVKTARADCLSCGKPLAGSLGNLGDLSDLFDLFGFGKPNR